MLEYLVAIFVGLVATYFYRRQKPKNYPPGLPNLPIVGSIPFLENNMLKNVQNLHKKFGPGMSKLNHKNHNKCHRKVPKLLRDVRLRGGLKVRCCSALSYFFVQ